MPLRKIIACSRFRLTISNLTLALLVGQFSAIGIAGTEVTDSPPADTHNQWLCQAGTEGEWVCTETTIPGPAYRRPPNRDPRPTASAAPADEPRVKVVRNLDWVDEKALNQEQRKAAVCCGAYIEPPRGDYPDAQLDPEQASMRASATSTEAQENVATMTGDVQISQGYRQVRSDIAVVDQEKRSVELTGNIQYREPGLLLLGERAYTNLDTQEIELENATFVMHESSVRGTASLFKRQLDDHFYVDNATYTTCEPGNNAWHLVARKVDINPDTGMATARHVQVRVKDVPILYTPWLRYPVDGRRVTGLLFPEVSMGQENGLDYAQPIYLNLAPNYDATVTPRYIQERGEMLELEFRHLSSLTDLTIGGAYLADDDGGDDSDEQHPAKKSFAGQDRWLANISHEGGMARPWRTEIDYTKVSDEDYFRDLGNVTLQASSRTHLKQLAAAGYLFDNWRFGLEAVEYQTLIRRNAVNKLEHQYQQLPRVDASGHYNFTPWGLNLELDMKHHYAVFDHRDSVRQFDHKNGFDLAGDTIATGGRLRVDYALAVDKQWAAGYIKPTVAMKYLRYDLDDPLKASSDKSPAVTVPVISLDTGLFFERSTTWLTNHIATFEPRLYYLHSDYKDQSSQPIFDSSDLTFSYQQLFRDDRFSGSDRIGDAEQITVGFTSRLIDARSGIEKLRGSLGQIFYLQDRYVSLNPVLTKSFLDSTFDPVLLAAETRDIATDLLSDDSNIAGEFAAYINTNWRFQSDILYDENSEKVDKGGLSLRYNNKQNAIFNTSYRFTRRNQRIVDAGMPAEKFFDSDIEQADISALFPLNQSWNLIARWNQDLTNSRELEVFGGIEYNSCCWRGSIIIRHWLDRDDDLAIPEDTLEYDDGIFFQFQLKGLAGTGTSVESILNDGIYGYEAPSP